MSLGYPDGQPRNYANNFANNNVTVSGTSGGSAGSTAFLIAGLSFGFNAGMLKMTVDVGTVYFTFGSTAQASTGDCKQTSGDLTQDFYSFGVGCGGMCLCATSTAAIVRVSAWG